MVKFVNFFAFAAVALGATIPVVKANQPKGELHSLSVTAIKEVTAELTEDEEEVENNQIETDINKAIVTAELDSGGRRGRKLKTFGADFRGEAFCLFGVRDVTDYFEADKPKADMDVGETCLLEFTDVEFKTKMEECSSSPTGWCKKIDYKAHFWFIEAANPIIVNYPGNWLTFSITVRSLMEGAVIDALKEVDGSEEDLVWEYLKDVWLIADPHIKTWSGKWYDYMGECDLKMIHAPQFNGKDSPLDINIRTKIRYEYSYIESAVLHLEGETFEVGSFGDYFLNGVSGARLPAFIAGYPITHSTPSEKVHVFEIKINNIESIIMKTFKDMVSVGFEGIDDERLLGSLGMVGSFNMAGKLIGRDGETEFEDPNAFADEWQIRQDEPMWFNSVYGPQHPQKCKLPGPTKTKGRRLGETLALEAAEKACAKYASENQEACVHDVMAIGDLDLASSGAF